MACADSLGVQPDIQTLLSPKFIGSLQGSSDQEIINAAKSIGLNGRTVSNLTYRELRYSHIPMVLHFRNSLTDEKFNHWVAFLGIENNEARIIDFPKNVETISFSELMAKWDGAAVLISDKPISNAIFWLSRTNYLATIIMLFGAVLFSYNLWGNIPLNTLTATSPFGRSRQAFFQTITYLSFVFIIACYFSCVRTNRFFGKSSCCSRCC